MGSIEEVIQEKRLQPKTECVTGCAHVSYLCGINQRPGLSLVPPLCSGIQDGDDTLSLAQGGHKFFLLPSDVGVLAQTLPSACPRRQCPGHPKRGEGDSS